MKKIKLIPLLGNPLIYFFIVILMNSCSSKKDILYLQSVKENLSTESIFNEYRIQVDDILKIDINSEVPEASIFINKFQSSPNIISFESMLYNGYQVDFQGNITLPSIDKINIKGKTIDEVKKLIEIKLSESEILTKPVVDIKILNSSFTVLGEVNIPGTHNFLKNNLNLFEAIGMAGDLTINGKRKDIKLLRSDNGIMKIYNLDLTNSNFISENFQVFPRDIIIVSPNSSRVKNAGIIGNSGTLISLLSFLLSSIILLSR